MASLSAIRGELNTAPYGRFTADIPDATLNRWINLSEARVWRAARWPWRSAWQNTLSVVSGTQSYAQNSAFASPISLYDQNGDKVEFLRPDDFFNIYDDPTVANGQPVHYTYAGGLVYLGPTPNVTASFKQAWLKRLQSFTSGGTAQNGGMSSDTDLPMLSWTYTDTTWHEIHVFGALSIGMQLLQSPAEHWQPVESLYQQMLREMVEEYDEAGFREQTGFGLKVWGEDFAQQESEESAQWL